jgi:hypothetical protein
MKVMFVACAFLLAIACGKDSTGVKPPPDFHLSDPEIFFHFWYQPPAHPVVSYGDTAVLRWWSGSSSSPQTSVLLAQVQITGTDSTCAYFLVAAGTQMYFDVGWKKNGAVNALNTIGPFDPKNPDNYDHYWDIYVSEDTATGSFYMDGNSNRTTSFCPKTLVRDSITAAALP